MGVRLGEPKQEGPGVLRWAQVLCFLRKEGVVLGAGLRAKAALSREERSRAETRGE